MTAKKHLYLVAVDGSEWGKRAADRAVALAKETGGEVRLIAVIPWSGFQPMHLEEVLNRSVEKREEERHAKDEILAPILAAHADDGVTISSEYHWGHPVKVIGERAKELKAFMVFIGRRGRSRVANLILGSVANSLAHSLPMPIVLVP
jgi:nucleotide-binding universal stress UspA family protein